MKHLIIITVYNKPQLTQRCLESLARTTDLKSNQVIIIDDASADPTRRILRKFVQKHPTVACIRQVRNIGKPRCLNIALKKFPNMDYYTILDNDIVIKSRNWVKTLIRAHRDWKNRAILGAKTYMSGYPFNKNGRHYLDPWPYWTLAGCFFSFSKVVFKKLGYFFDQVRRSEDADYCRRAYLAGFKFFYLVDIKAGISGHKSPVERERLRRLDAFSSGRKRAWSDQVMRTHRFYYRPNK